MTLATLIVSRLMVYSRTLPSVLRISEDDGGAGRTSDGSDRLIERDSLGVLAVDMGDDIAGLDAGLISRGVFKRADDFQTAVFVALDLNANAAEFALSGLVEFLKIAWPDHAAERIEFGESAISKFADQHFLGQLDAIAG